MPSTYLGISNNTHEKWYRDTCILKNAFWCLICASVTVYGGYDSSLLNGLQALPKFFETFPELKKSSLLGLTGAVQFLPGLVLPFVGSYLADRFGRKVPLTFTASGICVGAIVQCTANKVGVFIASRAIIGVAGSVGAGICGTMLAEIAHPRIRGIASALNNCTYYVGSIISSWTCYGTLQHFPESTWSWRLPSLLQALIPALILIPTILLPDSPRWLVSRGRVDDARRVLAQQHAHGDETDPLVLFELGEIEQAMEIENASGRILGPIAMIREFFRTPGNRKRLFIIINVGVGAQWNGVGIVSYYLVPVLKSIGITNSTEQTLVTGGLAISNLCFSVAGALFVEKLGRRPLWLISTCGMLVCMIIVTALSATFTKNGGSGVGGAVIAFLYLYYGAYDIAWTPLNVAYNCEILPFSLRASGMAIWKCATSVALCVNTWVNPIALEAIGYYYYIVYIGVLIYLIVVAYLVFPETKGLSLEEIAVRFDGENANSVTADTFVLASSNQNNSVEEKEKVQMIESV